jgi:hypothetical protein
MPAVTIPQDALFTFGVVARYACNTLLWII